MKLALAFLMVLGLVELGLRFGVGFGDPPLVTRDNEIEYLLLPSADYRRFGNRVEINRWSMRSRDHDATPASGELRILLIGDSIVYGNHFLDQSETIAARLEPLLAARLPGCSPLVMAAAASSWGPVNQAAFIKRTGTLGATSAVIVLSNHDLFDTPTFDGDVIPYRTAAPVGAIGDAVEAVIERINRRLAESRAPSISEIELDHRSSKSLAALDWMVNHLEAAGIRPIIVYHPTMSEREGTSSPGHAVFFEWAERHGLSFLDLQGFPILGNAYRDDIHPSPAGTIAIARVLAPVLAGRLESCG